MAQPDYRGASMQGRQKISARYTWPFRKSKTHTWSVKGAVFKGLGEQVVDNKRLKIQERECGHQGEALGGQGEPEPGRGWSQDLQRREVRKCKLEDKLQMQTA